MSKRKNLIVAPKGFLKGGKCPPQYNPAFQADQSPPTESEPQKMHHKIAGNVITRTLPRPPK